MSDPSPLDKEARLDLGPVQAIPPGQGRCFRIGSSAIAVFRLRDGALRALDAHCPHQGGLLSDGLVDNEKVLCPLHALAFSLHTGAGLHHSLRVSRYKEIGRARMPSSA
ncbi:nitrite reductase (NADH) small subunit [Methylacidimicrobium cyclopophantes]|uniref:Nitrite reductase (NADH) small subunit n=1 Tax=Methylacidimicrobium cyclopophantes TaxID=1041766 RepID=A0A5E6MH86_9BACT|nr:Rieske 2Fe-2S domain-containing protein [Methylacidimicrobium cyclopophantes]VVM08473.1 nitrite reductase (NADH) small subunit [Methylacidimicrobium cyclopophantes]